MSRQQERFSNVAPTKVLSDAINKLVDAPSSSSLQVTHVFVPSQKFRGVKKGYYFGTGARGCGYYRDPKHRGSCAKSEDFPWYSGPITNLIDEAAEEDAEEFKPAAVDAEELLRQAEEQAGPDEIQVLDARALKRLMLAFERKLKENMELRMKYPDQPDKFMDSEVDLDEQIKSLMQAAGSPELYPVLVDSTCVRDLLSLLTHENGDIAADVIELFMELTDADAIEDSEQEAAALVDAMLEQNALELLVHRLTALDEKQEDQAKTAFNMISVFENMTEVRQHVATDLVDKTQLLPWLLARIRAREFDSNKQYAASLLAILMQGNEKNQQSLAAANGIDIVLQSIAPYKNKDPQTPEEEEFLEDCFNVLCSSLMLPANKTAFVKSEGVELMVLMMRQKRISRFGAVKTLDFATTRNAPSCERFVDHTGLKLLFAIFMGKAKVKGPKGEKDVESEVEERLVSIISNLLQNLSKGARRERVAAKFVENQMEKLDRLFEIYFRYDKRVGDAEAGLANISAEFELNEDEVLLERLDAGLYTVQQCCLVLGHLWATDDINLRKRTVVLLHQKGQTLENVRQHLRELYSSIGSGANEEEELRQKRRVGRVLLAMGVDIEAEQAAQAAQVPPPEEEAPPLPPEEPDTHANGHKPHADGGDDVEMEVDDDDAAAPPLPPEPLHKGEERDPQVANGTAEENGERGPVTNRESERVEGGRAKARDAERHKDRERDRDRDKDRAQERDRVREKERDREKERGTKDRGERDVDLDRGRDRDRDKEREREREREREKERSHRDEAKRRDRRDFRAEDDRQKGRHDLKDERKRRRTRDRSVSRSP